MAGQPVGQRLGLGDAALPEAQRPANLHAVAFDLSPGPVIGTDLGRRHAHLASDVADVADGVVGQLTEPFRKPALPEQKLEDQPEAQPGRAALAAQ